MKNSAPVDYVTYDTPRIETKLQSMRDDLTINELGNQLERLDGRIMLLESQNNFWKAFSAVALGVIAMIAVLEFFV